MTEAIHLTVDLDSLERVESEEKMTSYEFTIPFPPVTKKNSQRILRKKNGGAFIAPSAKYKEYEEKAVNYLKYAHIIPFSDYPVNVKAVFYMPTAGRCDLVNLLEALDDVLVKAGILPDDNYKVIASHDGSRVFVDREKPRTEVMITEMEEYESEIND